MNKSFAILLLIGTLCIVSNSQCCDNQYWLYDFDRTFWMTNVYPYIASASDSIASTLNSDRRYFDYYMGVHQFTNLGHVILPHSVPIFWNSAFLEYPGFGSFNDIISNLNRPI